jgi:hypothetical protein
MMSPWLDADAKFNALICRHGGVSLRHRALHFDRTAHRVDDTGELDEEAVARSFDDATPMLGDFGIAEFATNRTQRRERALFVLAHQPRIASDIGGQDRGKAAGLGHPSGIPADLYVYSEVLRLDNATQLLTLTGNAYHSLLETRTYFPRPTPLYQ